MSLLIPSIALGLVIALYVIYQLDGDDVGNPWEK